jgi:uncharacterized membrane protein YraQ (UPF0718 family)
VNKNNKKMNGKSEMQKSQGKGKNSSKKPVSLQSIIVLIGTAVIAGILVYLFPDNRDRVVDTSLRFFYEMISILPAIVILIGLFAVFVPKQMVADYLGHASGVKGFLLAIFLGALPTGPLYVAFPIAAAMLKKGARAANMIVFLTAWACIKLPQEMVELKFMGLEFTLLRFSLTVTAAVVMGLLTERLMKASENPA